MGDLNLEAFLWVITLILWLFLYLFGRRNRQEALAAESPHPHMSDLGGPLNRRLRQAGLSSNGLGMLQYWSGKIGSAAGLALMALLIARIRSQPVAGTTLITMALIGFVLPDFWINGLRKRRMQKVRASLSFYLDLVVALLRAGLPVNRALFKAAHDGFNDPHPLAEEVLRVEGEIQAGKDRGTAFYALADRTGVQELRTLAAAVNVATKQGAPIEGTLESQAEVLRERRREEAIKRVNASASLAVLPIFLCGIPIFAVVVYFPAFLDIIETLRSLRIY